MANFDNFDFLSFFFCFSQVQVSASTFNTILKNLQSDTVYAVTVVPVYAAGEGKRLTENGKTCESLKLFQLFFL